MSLESVKNKVSVVLGGQWGDEGKGKVIDFLSSKYSYVARCQGGSNAGHTVVVDGTKFFFHLLPSCLVHPTSVGIIGNGVVIHLPTLFKEIEALEKSNISIDNRLVISDRAHIVFDLHQQIDGFIEQMKGENKIGTTKRGIGPAYASKINRDGIRMCDLVYHFDLFEQKLRFLVNNSKTLFTDLQIDVETELAQYKQFADRIRPFVKNTSYFMNNLIKSGASIMIEGANGFMLDIDHGTYPYVTSSSCGVAGVLSGLGIPASSIGHVNAVVKAYTTRVGGGVFPSELLNEIGDKLCTTGHEYGTTTGRRRRCGWLDLVAIKYAIQLNGINSISLTKLDVLDTFESVCLVTEYVDKDGNLVDTIPASDFDLENITPKTVNFPGWLCDTSNIKTYQDLPSACKDYLKAIVDYIGIPIVLIGNGCSRDQIIQNY